MATNNTKPQYKVIIYQGTDHLLSSRVCVGRRKRSFQGGCWRMLGYSVVYLIFGYIWMGENILWRNAHNVAPPPIEPHPPISCSSGRPSITKHLRASSRSNTPISLSWLRIMDALISLGLRLTWISTWIDVGFPPEAHRGRKTSVNKFGLLPLSLPVVRKISEALIRIYTICVILNLHILYHNLWQLVKLDW